MNCIDAMCTVIKSLDILLLKEWSSKWLLNINIANTMIMHLGNTNPCYTIWYSIFGESHYCYLEEI